MLTDTCKSGRHELAGPNLYITPDGRRRCRACQTQRDGTAGYAWGTRPTRSDTCLRGHDMTDPENVYVNPAGKRRCRACSRIHMAAHRRTT